MIGATVNGTGSFVMRAEQVGSETLLAQIVQHGQPGAAQPRSHSALGGPGRGLVRSSGDRRLRTDICQLWSLFGPRTYAWRMRW